MDSVLRWASDVARVLLAVGLDFAAHPDARHGRAVVRVTIDPRDLDDATAALREAGLLTRVLFDFPACT